MYFSANALYCKFWCKRHPNKLKYSIYVYRIYVYCKLPYQLTSVLVHLFNFHFLSPTSTCRTTRGYAKLWNSFIDKVLLEWNNSVFWKIQSHIVWYLFVDYIYVPSPHIKNKSSESQFYQRTIMFPLVHF